MIKVNNFYSGGYTNQEALDFLKKERIDFVFYSEYEKKYPNFNPDPLNFLKKVFDNEGVQIYQVIK